jgi:hypothetical protein
LARIQCGGHCRALALLLRRSRQSPCPGCMCDGSYCTSAVALQSAGAVWGNLALRRFLTIGAHHSWRSFWCSGALPSCGVYSRQPTTPRVWIDGKNRCTRRPT